MLPTQIVNLPIAGGLNEAVDARALEPPGAWLTVDNWVYDQAGALRKRNGYGAAGRSIPAVGASLPGTDHLDVYGAQIVSYGTAAVDGVPHICTYSPGAGAWGHQGWAIPASTRRTPVHRGPVGALNGHVARVYALVMHAWRSGDVGLFFKVTDASTDTVLVSESIISPHISAFTLFEAGGEFILVGYDQSAGHLSGYRFDRTAMAWGPPVTLYTPGGALCFDACPLPNGKFAVVVGDAALFSYELRSWAVATMTSVASNTQNLWPISLDAVAVQHRNGVIAIATGRSGPGDVGLSCHNGTTLAPTCVNAAVYAGMVTLEAISVGFTPGGAPLVCWQGQAVANESALSCQRMTTAGAPVGTRRWLYGATIAGKPFVQGSATYLLAHGAALLCLTDTSTDTLPLTLCGSVAAGEDVGYASPVLSLVWPHPFPQAWTVDGQWVFPLTVLTGAGATPGVSNTGIDRALVDFRPQQPGLWLSSAAQGCLATSGGLVGWFDGQSHTELGFAFAPQFLATTVQGPGTGTIKGAAAPNNGYLYTACYEWQDEAGNTHRSAFSTPQRVVVDLANNFTKIDLTIRGLHFTRKGNPASGLVRYPRVAIYRTTIGTTFPFYRLTPPIANFYAQAVITKPDTWAVTYTDDTDDAQLVNNAYGEILLEEQGGPLNNEFPPPALHTCTHKNRLWIVSADDDHAVWFSKMFVRGEGPGFNVLQQVRIDDSPDGITALASLDDKLVIFTPSRIYYVVGDGPADTGTNGSFSDPFLVTSAAGCLDARSVVTFDGGVAFKSRGGMYVLNRSLQVEFFGANVQETFRAYNNVLAVAHDPDRSWLVWLCGVTEVQGEVFGPKSIFLVHDYLRKAWFTWTTAAADADGVLAQVMVAGQHVWADHTTLALEGGGVGPAGFGTAGYDPGDTWITSTLETPWLKFAGMAGFERVRHVVFTGQRMSPHALQVELKNDFDETTLQTQSFDATGATTLVGLPVERLDVHVRYQKASAIKVRLSDAGPDVPVAGYPAGYLIAGLSLETGAKQGRAKLPQPNRR